MTGRKINKEGVEKQILAFFLVKKCKIFSRRLLRVKIKYSPFTLACLFKTALEVLKNYGTKNTIIKDTFFFDALKKIKTFFPFKIIKNPEYWGIKREFPLYTS